MQNVKNKIKNFIASGATIALMASGCATTDEAAEEKVQIILSKDVEANAYLSSFDRVCYKNALKEVRDKEAQKHRDDAEKQKYAMKCFDACGGAFIKKGNHCQYMPSKYEFDNNSCLCNGQDIIPNKQKEQAELEMQACQKICESANTDKKTVYTGLGKNASFWRMRMQSSGKYKPKIKILFITTGGIKMSPVVFSYTPMLDKSVFYSILNNIQPKGFGHE